MELPDNKSCTALSLYNEVAGCLTPGGQVFTVFVEARNSRVSGFDVVHKWLVATFEWLHPLQCCRCLSSRISCVCPHWTRPAFRSHFPSLFMHKKSWGIISLEAW
eukprot:TRINITY_DN66407_c8_g4_i3.p2 TRINITY_DN66407_c8_g4~~TRINITY_DN66407_c8_g4_i3.p2  ORF type:complete len:105 (+),score=0.03 TRINITY_DN66407_c8_g4_i3:238-552(+)